ncbi:MAG: hypothetical protein SGPRY_009033, partial [Prymnesium sp.]
WQTAPARGEEGLAAAGVRGCCDALAVLSSDPLTRAAQRHLSSCHIETKGHGCEREPIRATRHARDPRGCGRSV